MSSASDIAPTTAAALRSASWPGSSPAAIAAPQQLRHLGPEPAPVGEPVGIELGRDRLVDERPAQPAVGERGARVGRQHRVEPLEPAAALGPRRAHRLEQAVGGGLEQLPEQLHLRREVAVERAGREPGALGDRDDGRRRVAALADQLGGRGEQARAGRRPPPLAAGPGRSIRPLGHAAGSARRCAIAVAPREGARVMKRGRMRSERSRAARRSIAAVTVCSTSLHLELGEGGAGAAADAAAERHPRVRAGWLLEEALGPEAKRVGIDVGPAMDQVCAGRDPGAAGSQMAAELHRLDQLPEHDRQHRPQPQRLLDDGVGVGVLARAASSRSRSSISRVAQQALEAQASSWRSTRGRRSAA